ncbi:unnamed protein product [Cuscuta europaea]|uniref:Uncharacterized protein n=1 Tax=Cuscuta europaea TaxID=41803 RepID=A0A9P0YQP5_CUSEU|nr:unnamed protein product [Cuscuta europaea]
MANVDLILNSKSAKIMEALFCLNCGAQRMVAVVDGNAGQMAMAGMVTTVWEAATSGVAMGGNDASARMWQLAATGGAVSNEGGGMIRAGPGQVQAVQPHRARKF